MSKAAIAPAPSALGRFWYRWRFHLNVLLVLIPVLVTELCAIRVERAQPRNLFIYIFSGFFAAALSALLCLGLVAGMPTATHAQDVWPSKPLRLIVPFTPGGVTDTSGRLIAESLGKRLGQQIGLQSGIALRQSQRPCVAKRRRPPPFGINCTARHPSRARRRRHIRRLRQMVQKKATDFHIQPRIRHGCFIDGHKSPPERKEKGPKIALRPQR